MKYNFFDAPQSKKGWWKNAIIYEIYPKSFTSDGFKGIIDKLDYLSDLGVDAIWLCPIFNSPFLDSGYDISDYYSVNPMFGSMEDFNKLIHKSHALDIKVILDIALNHTSDSHRWFKKACEYKKNIYEDYYIFKIGKNEGYPNNWISSKTLKPTWTYIKNKDKYYFHIYTKYQPDLNWDCKTLRNEVVKILDFWIDKGVDGFRLDVINKIAKPDDFSDIDDGCYADFLFENNEKSHLYLKDIKKRIKKDNVLFLGQLSGVDEKTALLYAKESKKELDLFLQFDHIDIDKGKDGTRQEFTIKQLKQSIIKWQNTSLDGVCETVFFGSHDSSRMVSHYLNPKPRYVKKCAKLLAVVQLFLKGTQIIYMGDEFGITNNSYTKIEDFNDIRSYDIYKSRISIGDKPCEIIEDLNAICRDNARQMIDWNKYNDTIQNKDSVYGFYKSIINYRKKSDVIMHGKTISIYDDISGVFAYKRQIDDESMSGIFVIGNMTERIINFDLKEYEIIKGLSNYKNNSKECLKPYEVRVCKARRI